MRSKQYRIGIAALLCSLVIGALLLAAPRTTEAAPEVNPKASMVYAQGGFCTDVVRHGDALYKIAARYHTTTAYLAMLNNLYNPNYIYAGMVLKVPCAPPPPPHPYPQPQPHPYPQPGGGSAICSYYTVQRGDWLKTIAWHFGVSWQALAQANGLYNANYIYAGQKLAIPCGEYYPPSCPGCYPCQGCPPVYPTPPPPICPGCPPCQGCPPVYPTPPPPICPGCPPCQGCPPVYPTPPPPLLNIVELKDDYYSPAVITVRRGQFVQWLNQGNSQHTVTQGLCPNGVCTATPGGFDSGILNTGGTYGFQFNQLNTFAYFCRIHGAEMTGSVAVVP